MKKTNIILFLLCVSLLAISFVKVDTQPNQTKQLTSDDIDLKKFKKINDSPSFMKKAKSAPCAPFYAAFSPHEDKYIDVFVNPEAYEEFITKKNPVFPIGTIIVKKKYLDYKKDKSKIELYTVMTKKKYSDTLTISDWEFSVRDKNMKYIQDADIQKCQNCHWDYKSTDFVTRENYLPEKIKNNLK